MADVEGIDHGTDLVFYPSDLPLPPQEEPAAAEVSMSTCDRTMGFVGLSIHDDNQ